MQVSLVRERRRTETESGRRLLPANYRLTVTWAMDGRPDRKWLLHAENMDRPAGLRNVGWQATDQLGDLRERAGELIGGQNPEVGSLEVRLVVPPEIQAFLDRADDLDAAGAEDHAVARQLAKARGALVELGLTLDDVDQLMTQITADQ